MEKKIEMMEKNSETVTQTIEFVPMTRKMIVKVSDSLSIDSIFTSVVYSVFLYIFMFVNLYVSDLLKNMEAHSCYINYIICCSHTVKTKAIKNHQKKTYSFFAGCYKMLKVKKRNRYELSTTQNVHQ